MKTLRAVWRRRRLDRLRGTALVINHAARLARQAPLQRSAAATPATAARPAPGRAPSAPPRAIEYPTASSAEPPRQRRPGLSRPPPATVPSSAPVSVQPRPRRANPNRYVHRRRRHVKPRRPRHLQQLRRHPLRQRRLRRALQRGPRRPRPWRRRDAVAPVGPRATAKRRAATPRRGTRAPPDRSFRPGAVLPADRRLRQRVAALPGAPRPEQRELGGAQQSRPAVRRRAGSSTMR